MIMAVMILFLLIPRVICAIEVAIIVNKENATEDISFNDLVKIFRQEKQYLDGKKIYLIIRETGSLEKRVVLKKIYKMTNEELKKLWLTKMFRGEITAFPKTFASNEAVKRFISKVPNAVGFIDAEFLDDTVKVLKIDNLLPKDEGYILTETQSYEN